MIDTGTLTDLITQFRNTTAANSISPESVGSILQKIVDILATAGTQANLDIINKWHEALKNAAPALTALSQGNADRNHVYLAARSVNLYTGAQADLTPIQIQQATTERAGAMRAQQVTDLNAARRDVADIKKQIQTINSLLGVGTADNLYKSSQISCQVVNGHPAAARCAEPHRRRICTVPLSARQEAQPLQEQIRYRRATRRQVLLPRKERLGAFRLDILRQAQRHPSGVFHQSPQPYMHKSPRLVCRRRDTRITTHRHQRQYPLRPRS